MRKYFHEYLRFEGAKFLDFLWFIILQKMEGVILASSALFTVYIGAKWSAQEEEPEEKQLINKRLAVLFPIFGGVTLVLMYLALRYLSKEYIQLILQGYASLASIICFVRSFNPKTTFGKITATMSSIAIALFYFKTKHWMASNILAWALAANSISIMRIDSYNTGALLLGALFFYDIYFVFGTEVMVTVATGIDIPAKYVLPQFKNPTRLSMLGLGDIVMPGLMLALMYRFDLHNYINSTSQPKKHSTYFRNTFIAYGLGLGVTNFALYYFKAAQPALLYLSPACIVAPLLTAWYRDELKTLFSFRSETEDETDEQDKCKST